MYKPLGGDKMKSLNCNRGRLMTITYKELRERAVGLQKEKEKRIDFIKESAEKLRIDFISSLELENDTWTNIDGYGTDYVSVNYQHGVEPHFEHLNDISKHFVTLNFSTVVNDDPRGGETSSCSVDMASDKFAEELSVKVNGRPSKEFTIKDGDFTEVCKAMKDETYANISRLDDFN